MRIHCTVLKETTYVNKGKFWPNMVWVLVSDHLSLTVWVVAYGRFHLYLNSKGIFDKTGFIHWVSCKEGHHVCSQWGCGYKMNCSHWLLTHYSMMAMINDLLHLSKAYIIHWCIINEFKIVDSIWLKGKSNGNGYEYEIKGNSKELSLN